MEDWAEIRRLHRAEEVPIKEIARRLGIARNTVRAALASDRPPKYERPGGARWWTRSSRRSGVAAGEFPQMPATVIAERIGWDALDRRS